MSVKRQDSETSCEPGRRKTRKTRIETQLKRNRAKKDDEKKKQDTQGGVLEEKMQRNFFQPGPSPERV